MITGNEHMNPGQFPELELGYAGLRAKQIENILVQHAKAGKIDFIPGPYTKKELIRLAEGYVAMGKIPSVRPIKVDPRKKEIDDLKAQLAEMQATMKTMQSVPQSPPPPPPPAPEVPDNVIPARRPGRPRKED